MREIWRKASLGLCVVLFLMSGGLTPKWALSLSGGYCQAQEHIKPKEFAQASRNFSWNFPSDHGSHDDFQTEWWYFTGQLAEQGKNVFDDARLGFQLTFFRRAAEPHTGRWTQTYLVHSALSNFGHSLADGILGARYHGSFGFAKEIARGGLGVAGAHTDRFMVWNHGSSAEFQGDGVGLTFDAPIQGQKVEVRLMATPRGRPMLQGELGYSRKGECESCASQYYSLPRLGLRGEVQVGKEITEVEGVGWMDHEFMSSALSSEYRGWDWFALMARDGTDLMFFRLRGIDGKADFVSGTSHRGNRQETLSVRDINITELSYWVSPHTGGRYPVSWRISAPSLGIDEIIEPRLLDQEIYQRNKTLAEVSAPSYWEGAVRSRSGNLIGYVEMTGYSQAVGALF